MTVDVAARPTVSRVEAVDLARGFALLGMMLAHLGPRVVGGLPPVGDLIVGGRAAPLFALLAGVSLSLVHRRDPRGAGSAWATCVRAVCLFAIGLVLGSLDEVPMLVILCFYAVLTVAAVPFRRLSAPVLLALGGAWAVLVPVLDFWLRRVLDPLDAGQVELDDLDHPVDLVQELFVWGAYPALVWFAYVLVGLGVGRLDLRRRAVTGGLVGAGLVLLALTFAVAWAAIRRGLLEETGLSDVHLLFVSMNNQFATTSWDLLLVLGQHTSTPVNVVSAIGSALLVIGLCALAMRVRVLRLLSVPIRAAGSMTLTLYTLHVLWTWQADLPSEGGYDDWVLQVVVLCAAATSWRLTVGRGPLESLVRVVSLPRWRTRDASEHEKSAPEGA
jgi:uncharacterized protein